MSTKFVSKNSNYMVVLKPGIEGSRALGTHAIAGLYVKFSAGVVEIKEESVVEQMRAHPSFGVDFLEIKQEEIDPYLSIREEIEPEHVVAEIKYGHVEKAMASNRPIKLSPQLKKIIETEAIKMIPGLLKSNPKILKDIIVGMAAEMKEEEQVREHSAYIKEPSQVEREEVAEKLIKGGAPASKKSTSK